MREHGQVLVRQSDSLLENKATVNEGEITIHDVFCWTNANDCEYSF